MPALSVGRAAPDFQLKTLDGQSFSLQDALARGPVMLLFFKVSCPTCQYALPFYERLFQAYKGRNLTVAGVPRTTRKTRKLLQRVWHHHPFSTIRLRIRFRMLTA